MRLCGTDPFPFLSFRFFPHAHTGLNSCDSGTAIGSNNGPLTWRWISPQPKDPYQKSTLKIIKRVVAVLDYAALKIFSLSLLWLRGHVDHSQKLSIRQLPVISKGRENPFDLKKVKIPAKNVGRHEASHAKMLA
jgi:hypothetical protein